jgi:hypothetical protein
MNVLLRSFRSRTLKMGALPPNPRLKALNLGALSFGLFVALGLAGCADEKKAPAADADAGVVQGPQKAALGGKLGAAVAAAESGQGSAPSKNGDGPPESGVFAPGLADKAQPPGAPAKVELLGDGKEPRVLLAPSPADEQKETVGLSVRLQQQSAITVECTLALKVDKPKEEKKTDKKADGPKSWRVLGKLATLSTGAQTPRDVSEKFAKLKGTELRYTLAPDGSLADFAYTLPKDAEPATEIVLKGISEAASLSMPPLPQKPVGVGGYWIVTDRASTLLLDVVRYRVYKVEKIEPNRATLSVDVRQYAVKEQVDLGALAGGQKLSVQQFQSTGKDKIEWTAAGLLPVRGETSQRMAFAGSLPSGAPGPQADQTAIVQIEVSAKLSGDTDKADNKR